VSERVLLPLAHWIPSALLPNQPDMEDSD
jgi:hypothetical protein